MPSPSISVTAHAQFAERCTVQATPQDLDMSFPAPELAELSRALDSLSRGVVRYLCMQLGVRPATLSNIDASPLNDPLTCITKYLEAWLAYEGPLSWDVIADVLSSAQLGKTALAARIKRTYCLSADDPIADHAPCSPVSLNQLSESISSTSEDDVPGAGGIELTTFVQPQSQFDPVEDPLSGLKPAPSPSAIAQTKSKLNDQKLAKKITGFKRRFRAIVISANVHLSQQMSRTDFDRFKIDLTTLPMLGKTHHFLQKERKKIRKAKSVQKVFEILDPYWNHVDYALLEHIVVHYCNEKIKRQMARYKHKLHRFEKVTSVQRLKSVVTERSQIPSNYSALTISLDMDGEECSLYHAREIKESITERANLEPYVTLLENLHSSSVELTIAFPRTIRSHMEQTLPRIIVWSELGILPSSLNFCDLDQQTSTFSRVRDFFVHNSRREEITYTVRHRDLNPRYKDLGPEALKILCEEIESEHSDQEVTLQFQWKSREVEFHICGLEEGVCTALQLLQQKVLKSTSGESAPNTKELCCDSHLNKESFESSLMPDPPQYVREELTYFIKYNELKSEFRTLKSRRVKGFCEEIESQTKEEEVSIHFTRRPHGLEFTIAGLEEGVAKALFLILQEFQEPIAAASFMASSVPGHQSVPLTKEVLQKHYEQMLTEVRQFHCSRCDISWWRVVPSNKPVSRCMRCHTKFNALPQRWVCGVGRFICPIVECGYIFYSECFGETQLMCPRCFHDVESIHPRFKHKPHVKQYNLFLGLPFSSTFHISTGSTLQTWLSQPDSLWSASSAPIIQGPTEQFGYRRYRTPSPVTSFEGDVASRGSHSRSTCSGYRSYSR